MPSRQRRFAKLHQADPVLAYMNMMLLKAAENMVPVKRQDFQALGHGLKLFEGVDPGNNLNPGKIIHDGAPGISSNSSDA